MVGYFTRKPQSYSSGSTYYFENINNMYCEGRISGLLLSHRMCININKIKTYSLVRSKGGVFREFIGSIFKYYRGIEFEVVNCIKNNNVGRVYFKKRREIVFLLGNDVYSIKNHGEDYFSIKKNSEQIALLKKEPVSLEMCNKYFILYENEYSKCMEILLLILSANDYFYYCNDLQHGGISKTFYFRRAVDKEIYWRPSDIDGKLQNEAEIYLRSLEKLGSYVMKNNIIFLVFLFFFFIFICFIYFMNK